MKKVVEILVRYYVKDGEASFRFLLPPLAAFGLIALLLSASEFGGYLRVESLFLRAGIAQLLGYLGGAIFLGAIFTGLIGVGLSFDPRVNERMRKPLLWGGLIGMILPWITAITILVKLLKWML